MKSEHDDIHLSHETICIYIYSPKRKLRHLLLRCPNGKKSRTPSKFSYRGTDKNIPNGIDIDLRDELVNNRSEFCYFEADTVESCRKRGQKKSCLTAWVDRAARMTFIGKTTSKTADAAAISIVQVLEPLSNNINGTIYANGCEFSRHGKN